jgi:hypothetical protein
VTRRGDKCLGKQGIGVIDTFREVRVESRVGPDGGADLGRPVLKVIDFGLKVLLGAQTPVPRNMAIWTGS